MRSQVLDEVELAFDLQDFLLLLLDVEALLLVEVHLHFSLLLDGLEAGVDAMPHPLVLGAGEGVLFRLLRPLVHALYQLISDYIRMAKRPCLSASRNRAP